MQRPHALKLPLCLCREVESLRVLSARRGLTGSKCVPAPPGVFLPVQRHRGEPGHTPVKRHRGEPGHTRDTRAHTGTRISHRRTSQPSKPTNPRPREASRQATGTALATAVTGYRTVDKSQPRTGHTREPDPTHNELKHTTTRKTATHERTPETNLTFTRTHTPPDRRTGTEP